MEFISTRLPYRQTGAFSKIAMDYIDQAEGLKPFFNYPPTAAGINQAISSRKAFNTDRALLVSELRKQYAGVPASEKTLANIEALLSENTFTVTTAHQNNLFTGPLYFIYKIIHCIRLADSLNDINSGNRFVPIYWIGSEDADLDELNHIYLGGEKISWNTRQKGAVGRMKIDQDLVDLIDKIEGQIAVLPDGPEIISSLRACYKLGVTLQDATFHFVNHLFARFGLIVILPDNAAMKHKMIGVFENDLIGQEASAIVHNSAEKLEQAGYKVQANPREINLFYLQDDIRQRIEWKDGKYWVIDTDLSFTKEEMIAMLHAHPERFSPNVILRGLYQETILPNIAFIGGGGEIAYWLQLKKLFEQYHVPFPLLVLRNSFLVVEPRWREKLAHIGFTTEDIFQSTEELMKKLVAKESKHSIKLNGSLTELEQLYDAFKQQAVNVDRTLEKHVEALKLKTVQRLQQLEKKMYRAEKRKFADQQRQISSLKEQLFPGNGLQERRENLLYYYAKYGPSFIDALYKSSLGLEQEFVVLQLS